MNKSTIDKQWTYIRYFESFMRSNSSVAIVPMATAIYVKCQSTIIFEPCDLANSLTLIENY